jgi:hypothetical protein
LLNSHSPFAHRSGFWGLVLGLVAAVVSLFVAAYLFSFFAGVFKGKQDFNKGMAAVSLAAIPAYVGGILGPLPWVGWLVSLALSVVTLMFLYKLIPLYLGVPQDKRIPHYVVSLIATVGVAFVVNMVLGLGAYSTGALHTAGEDSGTVRGGQYGVWGEMGRQAKLMEDAEDDAYRPPADGRITDEQMAAYLDVLRKTAELRARERERIKQLEKDMADKEQAGAGDLGRLSSGLGAVFRSLATAEMEVVKTGGGNWAEHLWIKDQLRTAMIQKDINDAVKHNYAMYQRYADRLREYE